MHNAFWWDAKIEKNPGESKVHEALFDHVRSIEERQSAIHRLNLYNAKLYTNRRLACLTWGDHTENEGTYAPISIRKENLIANAVDTATNLIGRQRPKPTPVARDADFSVERLAKTLDGWLYSEFKTQKTYDKMQDVFNDCCWAQVAGLFIGEDNGEIYTERVMPDEIVVDQRECTGDAEPIQVHRRRLMSKVVLKGIYPGLSEVIEAAGSDSYTSYRSPGLEMLVVIETWKLALPGEESGRHTVVIQGATLVDEVYDRDVFPIVFLRWKKLPTGFYGTSLVEEGTPFQVRHDELNRTIQLAQDLMCVPRVFVDGMSRFVKTHLDNEIGRLIHFRGNIPTPMTWPAMPMEMYQQRDQNKADLFERIGISRMTAQQKMPEGMRFDSSKALRENNFRENERFQRQSAMLEEAYLQVAEHYIYHGNRLYADRKPPEDVTERRMYHEVEWKLLGDPGLRYVLQLEASSLNNMTPAAREDQLNTWAGNGVITSDEYKGMLGHPDLEGEMSLFQASMDDIKGTAQDIDAGKAPQPDPLQNLEFGIPYIHKMFLKRKRQLNMSPAVLDDYRDWLNEAQAILEGEEAQKAEAMAEQQQAAMAAENLGAPVGPEGTPLPAVATTAQGVPTGSLA